VCVRLHSAAFDVELSDGSWAEEGAFVGVEGAPTASFDKIGAGANVTHSFVLLPAKAGVANVGPAELKYLPWEDSDEVQWALTTPLAGLEVITKAQRRWALVLKTGRYASLGFLKTAGEWQVFIVVAGALSLFLGGNAGYKKANSMLGEYRQKKALEALEALEKKQ